MSLTRARLALSLTLTLLPNSNLLTLTFLNFNSVKFRRESICEEPCTFLEAPASRNSSHEKAGGVSLDLVLNLNRTRSIFRSLIPFENRERIVLGRM